MNAVHRRRVCGGRRNHATLLATTDGLAVLHLLSGVEASENTFGVKIGLLHGSDHGGVKALDDSVNKKVEFLIVDGMLGKVRNRLADLANLNSLAVLLRHFWVLLRRPSLRV